MASESNELAWISLDQIRQTTVVLCSSDSIDIGNDTVTLCRVLWGVLNRREISTDKPHERGRVQFKDHTGSIYCRLINGSSLWFDRPVLITAWRYVPVESTTSNHSSIDWLAQLEISEVRVPPRDMPPLIIKEQLLTGRLNLSETTIVSGYPPLSLTLTDEEQSTLDQLLRKSMRIQHCGRTASSSDTTTMALVGRVKGKTVVHRSPSAPTWFLVNIIRVPSNHCSSQRASDSPPIPILFYGNHLVDYYEQININDIVWFDQLQLSPSTSPSTSSTTTDNAYHLYFYSDHSTPLIRHLSEEQIARISGKSTSDSDNADPSTGVSTTVAKRKSDSTYWRVNKVIDIHLGIFDLVLDSVDRTPIDDPRISRILLFHTHDPSYYPWHAYRPGWHITIYNGHALPSLLRINGTLLMFACSATSVVINDTGSEATPIPLAISTADTLFFGGCEQRQWNVHTSMRAYALYQLLECKFPQAWRTYDMLAISKTLPTTSVSNRTDIGLLWRLIDGCQPSGNDTPQLGIRRDYMEEGLRHLVACPSMKHGIHIPQVQPLNMISKELYGLNKSSREAEVTLDKGQKSVYYSFKTYKRSHLPESIRNTLLVGVLEGNFTGQLVLVDATGSLPVILIHQHANNNNDNEDVNEDTDELWVHRRQRLPTHLLGHAWAISSYNILLRDNSTLSQGLSHSNLPDIYVQFDITKATCISQGDKPVITSLNVPPSSIYYFMVSHIHPLQWNTVTTATTKDESTNGARWMGMIEGYLQQVELEQHDDTLSLTLLTNSKARSAVQYMTLRLEYDSLKWLPAFVENQHYLIVNPTVVTICSLERNSNRRASKEAGSLLTLSNESWIEQLPMASSCINEFNSIKNISGKPLAPIKVDTKQLDELLTTDPSLTTRLMSITDVVTRKDISTNDSSNFVASNYHKNLINFTGIVDQYRLVLNQAYPSQSSSYTSDALVENTYPSSMQSSEEGQMLILRLVDRAGERTYWLDLHLDYDPNYHVLPVGLMIGDRISVWRAARKRTRNGDILYVTVACTSIIMEDATLPLHLSKDSASTPTLPIIKLKDTIVIPQQAAAILPGELFQTVVQLINLYNVNIYSRCTLCGNIIQNKQCSPLSCTANDHPNIRARHNQLYGNAFLSVTDGTNETYLSLNDFDTIQQLLQLNESTIERLRGKTMEQGKLIYEYQQELEMIYGSSRDVFADNNNNNSNNGNNTHNNTDDQMLLYQYCKRIQRYTGRLWIVGRLRSSRNTSPDRILLGMQDALIGEYLRRDTMIKNRKLHTLSWPRVTINGVRVEYRASNIEGRRLLQYLSQ